jgi:hypothetical protein
VVAGLRGGGGVETVAKKLVIDGALRKKIREALAEAYPSPDELRMVVSEALEIDTGDITKATDPGVAAFEIIQWFLLRGRLAQLVSEAAHAKPDAPRLKVLDALFRDVVVIHGPLRREIREALTEAFGTVDQFRIFASEDLNVDLGKVTRATSLPFAAFEAILWFLAEGRLPELVNGAAKAKPKGARWPALLARFAAEEGDGVPEQVILKSVAFLRGADWSARFDRARRTVCRIEPQPAGESTNGFGTGFLVGPDTVLTASHVAAWLPPIGPGRAVLRFDYEYDADGVSLPAGRACTLAPDWKLIDSPENGLDFTLIRLAERPGDDLITGKKPRGYLEPVGHTFEENEPLLIIQHAEGEALTWVPGFVLPSEDADRVRYNVNTKPGSSGSPCFTFGLDLVAVHHWGAELYNRGVRFSSILKYLKGSEDALAGKGLDGLPGLTK